MEVISALATWIQSPGGGLVAFIITVLGLVFGAIGVALVVILNSRTKEVTETDHYIDFGQRERYSEEKYRLSGVGRSAMVLFWGHVRMLRLPIPSRDRVKEIKYFSTKTDQSDWVPEEEWREDGSVVKVSKRFMRTHEPETITIVSRRALTYDELWDRITPGDPTMSEIPNGRRVKYEVKSDWDRVVRNFRLDLPRHTPEPHRIRDLIVRHQSGHQIPAGLRDIARIHEITWDVYEPQLRDGAPVSGGEIRLELQVSALRPGTTVIELDYERDPIDGRE